MNKRELQYIVVHNLFNTGLMKAPKKYEYDRDLNLTIDYGVGLNSLF